MKLTSTAFGQVIEVLLEKYPNRLPKDTISLEEIHRLIGQQDVIRYLVQHLEMLERKQK
jgi:hypothetical protein